MSNSSPNSKSQIPALEMNYGGDFGVVVGYVADGGTVNVNVPVLSFAESINQLKPVASNTSPNPMHYLSKEIGFYGRDDETRWMEAFCQTDAVAQFAILHGVGGVGKSKFMYEFIKSCANLDWHMCFLSENIITSLLLYPNYDYPKNLFVVIDYASRNSEVIGKWIAKLSSSNATSYKIRIVLIERQGQDADTGLGTTIPWFEKLYGSNTQHRLLKQIEYGFLKLGQITSDHLSRLIDDFVGANYPNRHLDVEEVDNLLNYASYGLGIDESRQSPLIVLLIADAYAAGQDYRKWNLATLVRNYIEKLKSNWLTALCDNNIDLHKSLIRVLVFATAVGGYNVNEEIPAMFSSDINLLIETPLCRWIFEGSTGFADDVIHAVEPDIIGEFFVLDYLDKIVTLKMKREFILGFYSHPFMLLDFMDRCIEDYAKTGAFDSFFNSYFELIKPPINAEPYNELYVMFLGCYFYQSTLQEKTDCLGIVKKLHIDETTNNKHYLIGITTLYAWFLADVTIIKEYEDIVDPTLLSSALDDATNAMNELRFLYEKHSAAFPKVVSAYARALANFALYSSESESYECVTKLQEMYDKNSQWNLDIVIAYAMSLNNHIRTLINAPTVANATVAEDLISKLEILYKSHGSPVEQQSFYCDGVVIEYAKGLNNLLAFYVKLCGYDKASHLFNSLMMLMNKHKEFPKIKIEFSKAIANYIYGCDADEADELLRILKHFTQTEKANQNILIIRYVNALTNRLARLLDDGVYCENIDNVFSEVCNIYFQHKELSQSVTKRYATCLYYMFNILIRTRHFNEDEDELDLVYNALFQLHEEQTDPILKSIAGQYIERINRMFE